MAKGLEKGSVQMRIQGQCADEVAADVCQGPGCRQHWPKEPRK